jgi:hypothetical protein
LSVASQPGLDYFDESQSGAQAKGRLLVLEGWSQAGHHDGSAFSAESLVDSTVIRDRFEVTYESAGWNGLAIRANWRPTKGRAGVDLEIQASVGTAAVLRQVEIHVSSRWPGGIGDAPWSRAIWVEPRAAETAPHTHDGGEAAPWLARLGTLAGTESRASGFGPLVVSSGGRLYYVEMAHPDDVARRIVESADAAASPWRRIHRYGLLGHDIEKGIVLRARLRGLWIESDAPAEEAESLYQEFLREPPPLGA